MPSDSRSLRDRRSRQTRGTSSRSISRPPRRVPPGRCFVYGAGAPSRNFEFFQVEGLVVDHDTSLADLKGMLEEFARALYGEGTQTRFRPGHYPFTEPRA